LGDRDRVLIVDYGGQYTQLIARRVRELSIYCEVVPPWVTTEAVREFTPGALILSGGPSSVHEADAPRINQDIRDLDVPILGICYGMQLLVQHLGGDVQAADDREFGRATLRAQADRLFEGVPDESTVWMSHGDRVEGIPRDFRVIATSDNSPFAAVRAADRPLYGVQFHPEVAHTDHGTAMLRNFLIGISGLAANWTMGEFIARETARVRERVGTATVICGVSGGVDSTVVAALLHRAIGDQLQCFCIDNGVLRQDEQAEIRRIFDQDLKIPLKMIDASDRFLSRLRGIEDPEKKRVTIGHTFVEVFEEAARSFPEARFLAQGTLYPDVIESVSVWGPSATIKTHHNVGGLPDDMELEVVEPLRMLFKDEVRRVADELGIAKEVWGRHPFPGPGLAIRVVGEVTPERLEILRRADQIVVEEVRRAGWYDKLWQAFAVFLPVQSVGVMGDGRTYEHTIAVRCVTSQDAMTGDWAHLPPELLGRISNRVINEVSGVNRVVYDISSKPPATIEWE
jgi:GMP synthase (glutamine-hydrolysing)